MGDELLQRLARLERETRPAGHWDDVLDGRRAASDVVAQREAEGDDIDELNALAEASAPLQDTERTAWARRVRAGLSKSADDADEGDESEPGRPLDDAEGDDVESDDAEGDSPPIDLAQRRTERSPWGWGIVAVAVAVAAMVFLWMRAPAPLGPSADVGWPPFHLVVRNGTVGEIRGGVEDSGPARYRTDSILHWTVGPDAPVVEALELGVLVEDGAGLMCLRRPPVARSSADGVFELRGPVDEVLGLAPGRWQLSFIIAPKGQLPVESPASGCTHPRSVPCPCPSVVKPGATIEPATMTEGAGSAWQRVDSYAMVVESG